jgi:hypothetical protein
MVLHANTLQAQQKFAFIAQHGIHGSWSGVQM